jgi:hypothetical protein
MRDAKRLFYAARVSWPLWTPRALGSPFPAPDRHATVERSATVAAIDGVAPAVLIGWTATVGLWSGCGVSKAPMAGTPCPEEPPLSAAWGGCGSRTSWCWPSFRLVSRRTSSARGATRPPAVAIACEVLLRGPFPTSRRFRGAIVPLPTTLASGVRLATSGHVWIGNAEPDRIHPFLWSSTPDDSSNLRSRIVGALVGASNNHTTLMYCGVVNAPCRSRGRGQSGKLMSITALQSDCGRIVPGAVRDSLRAEDYQVPGAGSPLWLGNGSAGPVVALSARPRPEWRLV